MYPNYTELRTFGLDQYIRPNPEHIDNEIFEADFFSTKILFTLFLFSSCYVLTRILGQFGYPGVPNVRLIVNN